jgi:hypothetical protein
VSSPTDSPADPDSLRRFARVYVVSTLMILAGIALFVTGAALAVLTPITAYGVVLGSVLLVVGLVASNVAAYRFLRQGGASRYSAWMRCGGLSWPLRRRYKQQRALLNEREPSP